MKLAPAARMSILQRLHRLAILLMVASAVSAHEAALTVASYNLRFDTASDGPNAWPERRNAVQALIHYHAFDVFGTQEGLAHQLEDLASSGEYAYVGVGRDDGKRAGEFTAIFYRKERLTLLRHGDFWLSDTPHQPSRGWDGKCCNRIASWAELRDRRSAKTFFVFSAHFDHEGVIARRESAKLLVNKIAAIAGKHPVICLGDFNTTPESEPIATLRSVLHDARGVSQTPPYGPIGTFNGFELDAPLTDRIDYIFVSADITVQRYAALSDTLNGRFPSDHLPVVAQISIADKR